jgi:hypothetical protein
VSARASELRRVLHEQDRYLDVLAQQDWAADCCLRRRASSSETKNPAEAGLVVRRCR